MKFFSQAFVAIVAATMVFASAGCGTSTESGGIIAIDGSSTVFPITEAVAEEFQKTADARVTIGVSGTGGGFKKFCQGETAISGASRPIKPSEVELCESHGIEYIELPIAYDGLAVVVNPENNWADHITVAELKTLWEPAAQGKVTRWSQVRPGWPDEEIHLFGAGVDSGTFDYFTLAIVGEEHASRGDFTSSEDDNVLVQGLATDPRALGFFGYAYYAENHERLKLVPIDNGNEEDGAGAIAPSPETVANGTYQPLSRPIFIYVSKAAADRPEVQNFVHYYLEHAATLVAEVGYISLPASAYGLVEKRFDARKLGSLFAGHGSKVGVTVEDLLAGS
jgi:phosphate transport system substrate-binding protein